MYYFNSSSPIRCRQQRETSAQPLALQQAVCHLCNAVQAFRVLLQQQVSAVAVLSGVGSSVNMRLVGNLSASDLRHLKQGGFGRLAMSVKQFLASKPVAPDQVCLALFDWSLSAAVLTA